MARAAFVGVAKRYGSVEAVRDLTLEIADGELMVLVGPSGSGKTTALRMLAGLEAVNAGQIEIGDRVVNSVSPRDRDVAMVFQDYALYPQMTVRDNMAFGLRRRGLPRAEVDRRVTETCATLGLAELLDRRPRQLSGGQQQRVALGRALVREPQVLLMDEPLSNLDAQLRIQARGEIKRLQAEVGTTTIYVTHDQVEAMTLGDRIAVMDDGVLQQVGTPEELYERPDNEFVGRFIGAPGMSFLRDDDGTTIGVRPEHVRLWREGLRGPIDGRVAYVEALGRETLVGVDVADGARLVAAVDGRADFTVGEPIRLGLVEEGLRRFGADGRRLG